MLKATPQRQRKKAADAILLLASLALLAGCQGVSTGGTSSQQLTSNLSLAATTLNFGNVTPGSSKTLTVTVANSGNASATINSSAVSTKYFSVTGPSLPILIAAGQSAVLSIKFAPNASGNFSAAVSLTSDASNTLPPLSLSGTGVAAEGQGQVATNPSSEDFGSLMVGSKQSQSVTLENTGATTVTVSQVAMSGAGFQLSGITTPLTLNASQSTVFSVTFAPQSSGSASGSITITSDGSNPTLTMALSGSGVAAGALASAPASLSFGSVTVAAKQSLSGTVSNSGGSSVTISGVGVSGTGFSLSGITAPLTLAAGQSASFTVVFAPQSAGSASGNVTITSSASNPTLTIPLSGTGTAVVGQLAVTPGTLSLGSVVAGTSGTATGSLTASGANVTIAAAGTNNSVFSISKLSLPVTIAAGQSVPFTVTFSPQTTGAATATLTFTSDAQSSTTAETLTGTGLPVPTHSVSLSWNASTSSDISGYNIYRSLFGTSCGGYEKINSVLNTNTLYTDSTVVDGTSYCYASTAVSSSNEESGYSNIVANIQIPPP